MKGYRVGHGFDVHRLRRGRKLILGGVEIPYPRGLIGHSDADVVIHALINALLGAMGKGDIGCHFPDSDPRYRGVSSGKLLRKVLAIMDAEGFRIVNGDITLVAQEPKVAPYFEAIRQRLAKLLGLRKDKINIKAVTPEGLGWLGQGRGMAATAVVLLEEGRQG